MNGVNEESCARDACIIAIPPSIVRSPSTSSSTFNPSAQSWAPPSFTLCAAITHNEAPTPTTRRHAQRDRRARARVRAPVIKEASVATPNRAPRSWEEGARAATDPRRERRSRGVGLASATTVESVGAMGGGGGGMVLGYWAIRGLGQPIRLLLEVSGIEYEEKRYALEKRADGTWSRDQWFDVKHKLGLPFPNLPYLIDGDLHLTQTQAILDHGTRSTIRRHRRDAMRTRTDPSSLSLSSQLRTWPA